MGIVRCYVCAPDKFQYVCPLVSLMDKVGLQKNSCKVIDVTNKRGTVETLTETKILCSIEEKVCDQSCSQDFSAEEKGRPCARWKSPGLEVAL